METIFEESMEHISALNDECMIQMFQSLDCDEIKTCTIVCPS